MRKHPGYVLWWWAWALLAVASAPSAACEPPVQEVAGSGGESADPGTQTDALALIGARNRGAVVRRSRHVYRLPDGSVWDGSAYAEFRAALAEFDSTRTRMILPARARAWGFKPGVRRPETKDYRPDPLWHSLQRRPHEHYRFIYINADSATLFERTQRPHVRIEKVRTSRLADVTVHEFPGAEPLRFPTSIPFGTTRVTVQFPIGTRLREGDAVRGEFFLIPDASIAPPRNPIPTRHVHRFVHAQELRLTPEQYAAALLAGEAELVEWSFRRDQLRPDVGYIWMRRVVDILDDWPIPADPGEFADPDAPDAEPPDEDKPAE